MKDMDIRAADACPYCPQEDFSGCGFSRGGNVPNLKEMG
jgi:hypothetical protein